MLTEKRLRRAAYVRWPAGDLPRGRTPKVSIIISCFNYGRFLRDSIGSALTQEGVLPEVIVVDDASTDDSVEVAERYAKQDSRITLIRHPKNLGAVIAFNDGYAAATGEFIVRLDADDLLTPGSLARSVALFDSFPNVGLVYGHPRHFTTKIPPGPRIGPTRAWSVWSGADWLAERCRRAQNVITTPEAVCRASVMKKIGPLDPRLTIAHDMEMWLRVAAVSDIGRVHGPDQALHRDHLGSMTASTNHLRDIKARRDVFDIFFGGPNGCFPDAAAGRELVQRRLAAEALTEACRAYDRGRTRLVDVDGYINFALETYADAQRLSEWRSLERRRRCGPSLAPYLPIFFPTIVRRGLEARYEYWRWTKTGLF